MLYSKIALEMLLTVLIPEDASFYHSFGGNISLNFKGEKN